MLEDFLFRNRNKDYGAWKLRKQYKKTVWISLCVSTIAITLLFVIPLLFNLKKEYSDPIEIPALELTVELVKIKIEPPKPVNLPEQKIENAPKPIIKEKSDSVLLSDSIAKADSLKRLKELAIQQQAKEDPRLKEEAVFECGNDLSVFRSWFTSNLTMPEGSISAKKEIKFVLHFTVNTKGFIDSVFSEKEISLSDSYQLLFFLRAKSLLMRAPRWKPCTYKGKTTRQMYILPIYIVPKNI